MGRLFDLLLIIVVIPFAVSFFMLGLVFTLELRAELKRRRGE